MKKEIDQLMKQNQIDALLVSGDAFHNPAMTYLTGGGHVTQATLIKPCDGTGTVFCNDMEREEAAKTHLNVRTLSQYPLHGFYQQADGDVAMSIALRYKQMLEDLGITHGRVALYGQVEVGPFVAAIGRLSNLMPDIEFTGFYDDPILLPAMMTKDPDEIDRIRKIARTTTEVVSRTADFITSHHARNEMLVKPDGQPLRIKDVKSNIDLWLAELGAENPEGTIFAIGRDAGVPHSSGSPNDVLRLGETIVFDIFPCEAGGGYFYDFTRTWSLGYATDKALELYVQVLEVYKQIVTELKLNAPFQDVQRKTCELFEAYGHPTSLSTPGTQEGYVHSIGHGVGLHIHEMPFSGANAGSLDILAPGSVFAIEPGLYYPSRGMGFRVENTFVANADGTFESLAEYPYDFVLPIRQ